MKVLVNGGLNLSELDGWWAEAYSPEVGWAIGDGKEHGEDPGWDLAEAEALYGLLEREVTLEFYERDKQGLPLRWLERIRKSMTLLTPEYSASRAVRQYTQDHYLGAASGYRERAAGEGALGASLLAWRERIVGHWNTVRFGTVDTETHDGRHFFRVQVFSGDLHPDELQVELYAEPLPGDASAVQVMTAGEPSAGVTGAQIYSAQVAATCPASDYTPRVIPHHANASVPLEAAQILWQR
jgi:starch phosphorylase